MYDKNGEVYIGHFQDGKPHGFASWYKNGKPYYVGMWANGKFHGEGTLYKEDGSIKSGEWDNGILTQTLVDVQLKHGHYNGYVKNNKPDGIGTMEYADGSLYFGKWKDGNWNGPGTYITNKSDTVSSVWVDGLLDGQTIISSNGLSYKGGYMEGFPHGLCEIKIPNCYSYFGYMSDGVKSGYGELILFNGDSYKGDWNDNLFDGDGVYVYANEHARYDGQWYNGLQDGIGYYQSPQFAYRGEWEEGWINGYGKMVFSNKDLYVGRFVENKFYGDGAYLFSNGNKYDGEFVDGKFNGLGSFYFANGDSYIGEFKEGEICGDGTLTIYEKGKPISITANWPGNNIFPAKGSILFSNGDIYEGELVNGIPTRNGKWTTETDIENNESWADKANDFYKNHKEEFDKISTTVTYITVVVAVAATVTAAAVTIASTGGAAAPAALVATSKVLGTAATVLTYTNTTLYAGSIAASTASAAQDYRNTEDESEKSAILNNTVTNLAVDAIFFVAKKGARSTARAAKVALSRGIKSIGKRTVITISKNKTFGKVITIVKGKNGVPEQRLVNANRKTVRSTIEKGKQKFESLLLRQLIRKTQLYKRLQEIKAKGQITLSAKTIEDFRLNKVRGRDWLKNIIEVKTGNKNNFQEFFIRLAMSDKKLAKEILENRDVREYINACIRRAHGGGNHEWLMCKNFDDFLTNSKWGDDGSFLALAITELVQKTTRINFKYGGKHGAANSGTFHNKLAGVIASCDSKEELFVKVRTFAKEHLVEEDYKLFNQIFKDIVKPTNT